MQIILLLRLLFLRVHKWRYLPQTQATVFVLAKNIKEQQKKVFKSEEEKWT